MRYAVHRAASQLPLTGWVENMEDGRVQIVVEGSAAAIDQLLEWVQTEGPGLVRKIDRFDSAASGEFRNFEIRR
jgi:acylphosphatase